MRFFAKSDSAQGLLVLENNQPGGHQKYRHQKGNYYAAAAAIFYVPVRRSIPVNVKFIITHKRYLPRVDGVEFKTWWSAAHNEKF